MHITSSEKFGNMNQERLALAIARVAKVRPELLGRQSVAISRDSIHKD